MKNKKQKEEREFLMTNIELSPEDLKKLGLKKEEKKHCDSTSHYGSLCECNCEDCLHANKKINVLEEPQPTKEVMGDWTKEFDESVEYWLYACFQENGKEEYVKTARREMKSFIQKTIHQAKQEELARIEKIIEEYFKGLVMIPAPELTLKNLKFELNEKP